MQLYDMTLHELSDMLAKRKISSKELTLSVLDRIDVTESRLNSFITVDRQGALKQAESVDFKRSKGENLSVLAGIPIGLKDNICTAPQKCLKIMSRRTQQRQHISFLNAML